MGIWNDRKLIVNCLPLTESERAQFIRAAKDIPQEFVGDSTTGKHELDRRSTGGTQSQSHRGHRQHRARGMRAMPQTRMASNLECRRRQIPATRHPTARIHAHQCHRSLRTKRLRTHVRHDVGHHEEPAHLRGKQPERHVAGRGPRHQPQRKNGAHHRNRRHRITLRTTLQKRRNDNHRIRRISPSKRRASIIWSVSIPSTTSCNTPM